MRFIFLLLFLSMALGGCSTSSVPTTIEPNSLADNNVQASPKLSAVNNSAESLKLKLIDKEYLDLVTKIKVLPLFGDIVTLKSLYIQTQFYKPFIGNEKELSHKLAQQIDSSEWQACLETSKRILKTNYLSLNAHYSAMACAAETQQIKLAKYHKNILNFLLDDIWNSGNGLTPETAIVSMSSTEVDAFLTLAGMDVLSKSLVEFNGKTYEKIFVKEPEQDKQFELFFDLTTAWEHGFKSIN